MKMKHLVAALTAVLISAASAQTQVGQVTLTPVRPATSTSTGGVKPRPTTPVNKPQAAAQTATITTTRKSSTSFQAQQVPAGWYNLTGQVTANASLPKGSQVTLTLTELQQPSKVLLQINFGASRLPVPYQMYFNQARLQAGKTYAVRAKVFSASGKLLYVSDPIVLPKTSPSTLNIPVQAQ